MTSLATLFHSGFPNFLWTSFWFLVVLTVLVFVHEFGHYFIARRNGVHIEVFSIGFGPELFGWYNRAGTRWRFSAIPFGGYVKMFGDSDPSSGLPAPGLADMSASERGVSFHHKRLGQRAAIAAAGPAANFVFAILVLAGLFMTFGQPYTPAQVSQVLAGSAAARGGIKPGDLIVGINGAAVHSFEDVQQQVALNGGVPMTIVVKRGDTDVSLHATPTSTERTDRFGNHWKIGELGIMHNGVNYVRRNPAMALFQAGAETWNLSASSLRAIWQMVEGTRSTDELGGPLRIAQISGEVARGGVAPLLQLMAFLSVSLGLINLFPIPVLDGGHLLYYAAEGLRGKPLGRRAQEYGLRIGLALVLTLMVFVTWNDLRLDGFVKFVSRFIS